jgi:hypothetical protein
LASGAYALVEYHNSVFPLGDRLLRTGFSAWRLIAVPAYRRNVEIFQGIANDPRAVFCYVNEFDSVLVFLLTGYLTGFASPTEFGIYYKSMLVHCFCLLQAFSG